MNRILFEPEEIRKPLRRGDERFFHITRILKLSVGQTFKAGVINGDSAIARIEKISNESIVFEFESQSNQFRNPVPVIPVIGACRPPVAKRLLKDLASMMVERIIFIASDLTEKSYLRSRMWKEGEFRKSLIEGASQGGITRLPEVSLYDSLGHFLKKEEAVLQISEKIIMDNNPDFFSGDLSRKGLQTGFEETCLRFLAVGPERGWSDRERKIFEEKNFSPVCLSQAILRTETAVHCSIALLLEKIGLMHF